MRPARGRLAGQALERYNGHPKPSGQNTEHTSETKIRKTHNRKPLKQKQKQKCIGYFKAYLIAIRLSPG